MLSIYLDLSNFNFKKILRYARLIFINLFWHQKKLPFYLFEKKPHTPCRSVHLNSLYKEIFKCIVIYISFYKVLNISHGMLDSLVHKWWWKKRMYFISIYSLTQHSNILLTMFISGRDGSWCRVLYISDTTLWNRFSIRKLFYLYNWEDHM